MQKPCGLLKAGRVSVSSGALMERPFSKDARTGTPNGSRQPARRRPAWWREGCSPWRDVMRNPNLQRSWGRSPSRQWNRLRESSPRPSWARRWFASPTERVRRNPLRRRCSEKGATAENRENRDAAGFDGLASAFFPINEDQSESHFPALALDGVDGLQG